MREEFLRFRILRFIHDFLRRTVFGDNTVAQQHNAVRSIMGETHFMGRHENRGALLFELGHHVQHLAHQHRVKCRGNFVKEQQFRIGHQRSGDGHALLLATGKLIGVGTGLGSHTDAVKQLQRAGFGTILIPMVHLERRQGDVLNHRHVRKQVELLEDHADARTNLILVGVRIGDIRVSQPNLAIVDTFQQIHAFHQRRLSRTGRA